jgi:inosine-uridine nucleoside N-ribohydrolase
MFLKFQDAVRNIMRVLECTNSTDIPVYRGAREALGNTIFIFYTWDLQKQNVDEKEHVCH